MKLTNAKMSLHLNSLNKISNKVTGKLAYCVARNIRKLGNELVEFEKIKDEYICKHGEKSEDGLFVIKPNTDSYNNFIEYIKEYTDIEHEVDIFKVSEEEFFKTTLTADEILDLDFMIKDDE